MTASLEGKIAVVTGASSGIGRAIAAEFVAEGARVYLTGRRKAELDAAVAEIGPGTSGVRTDAADLSGIEALFRTVREREGRLDILVANAGGGGGAPLGTITEQQYDTTFDINVKGLLFTVQEALPLMDRDASVILIGSTTSIRVDGPGFSVYAASKAAVRSFARSWAVDLRGRGIRVNVLTPGPTRTPGLLGLARAGREEEFLDSFAARIPLGRVADPTEIATAAVFLASGASSFVNGAELFVDGGHAQI
ncbi:SDR family oxidoreductase [Streptomyces sp. NBC_01317]|uniref:SDR family NAD(P)-dependent oxidoreductase n=1 Tax=Streptomyces sp. NBC_01317 TaxID=2903822 RepID=UPI002E138702|nr:SDR family oxidoreductase [Streptomyces sp. NBC_01317]